MRAIDEYNAVQELKSKRVKVPWSVWCMMPEKHEYLRDYGIEIVGDDITFGGDFQRINVVKENFDWLVEQLGGVILWGVD